MTVTVAVDQMRLKKLLETLGGSVKDMRKQIRIAVNKAGRNVEGKMVRMVREEINVSMKGARKVITRPKLATDDILSTTIVVSKDKRIPLKEFGAKQAKPGVSYMISKRGGRKMKQGAFIVKSLGGHVFMRQGEKQEATKGKNKGRMRQRIYKQFGTSIYGFFIKRIPEIQAQSEIELDKQIRERVRLLTDNIIRKLK
jgi:hypothetical protein